ncbi:MAG: HEPN domain-containing protein [Verrucomicrobia bacterium]|nr:HEPN domain-containing protein [Verrucomicrobiota bacterium]
MSAKIPAVEAWVRKAENDFKNIRDSLRGGDPAWDTVCYHAQQGSEKYLKACLIVQGIEPPRVHDLEELLIWRQPRSPNSVLCGSWVRPPNMDCALKMRKPCWRGSKPKKPFIGLFLLMTSLWNGFPAGSGRRST